MGDMADDARDQYLRWTFEAKKEAPMDWETEKEVREEECSPSGRPRITDKMFKVTFPAVYTVLRRALTAEMIGEMADELSKAVVSDASGCSIEPIRSGDPMSRPATNEERLLIALGMGLERKRIKRLMGVGHEVGVLGTCAAHSEGLYCCVDHLLEELAEAPTALELAAKVEIVEGK